MTKLKVLGVAALLIFALSAITATAAQALEGPFYKVEGKRLAAGESAELETEATEQFVLSNGVQQIICTKLKVEPKATIRGSSKNVSGTSREILVFSGCSVTGNGEPCEVTGGTIKTEEVENILDFGEEKPKAGAGLLVLFKPVKGAVFVKVKFTGAGCTVPEAAVEGSVAGQSDNEAQERIKAESATETEGKSGLIIFPNPASTIDCFFNEKEVETCVKPSIKSFGKAAKFTGHALVKLSGKQKWGVFTH